MDTINLTQYISKYRQIILKLEGIDMFKEVHDFLRGLHHDYKTKVKTQNSKILEDATKNAQTFDDNIHEKP